MVKSIIVNLQFEGIHNWPSAINELPKVGFLSENHRHIFCVTVKKQVSHSDRDVEIIMFKRDILKYLKETYYNFDYEIHMLGSKSCEMIAEEILTKFDCSSVAVLEDNENGAIIEK